MKTLYIEHEGAGKTRGFRALLLAYVSAAKLWDGGDVRDAGKTKRGKEDKLVRPVYMVVAGSKSEVTTVMANLRSGERATILDVGEAAESYNLRKAPKLEMRRSAGYKVEPQLLDVDETGQRPERHEAKIYELCREDPGMIEGQEAAFLSLPAAQWLDGVVLDVDGVVEHMKSLGYDRDEDFLRLLVKLSPFFIARLVSRSEAPIINDLRFWVQVLVGALGRKLATMGAEVCASAAWAHDKDAGYIEHGLADVGLLPGIAFKATQDEIRSLLIEQVKLSSLWRS